jgi:hypothetical protein
MLRDGQEVCIWTQAGPKGSYKYLKRNGAYLFPKQFWLSNLLNRLAWFCVLYYGFRGCSALSGPKLDPSFALRLTPWLTPWFFVVSSPQESSVHVPDSVFGLGSRAELLSWATPERGCAGRARREARASALVAVMGSTHPR